MDSHTMHYNERGSIRRENNAACGNTRITFPMMLPTSCMRDEDNGKGGREGEREGGEAAWRKGGRRGSRRTINHITTQSTIT